MNYLPDFANVRNLAVRATNIELAAVCPCFIQNYQFLMVFKCGAGNFRVRSNPISKVRQNLQMDTKIFENLNYMV